MREDGWLSCKVLEEIVVQVVDLGDVVLVLATPAKRAASSFKNASSHVDKDAGGGRDVLIEASLWRHSSVSSMPARLLAGDTEGSIGY